MLKSMKKEIRVLGISDGYPRSSTTQGIGIVGVVFRGAHWLEGVMKTMIEGYGSNATSPLVRMIRSSPHYQQIRVIITDGLALGDLNIVNIKVILEKTGIPVISVSRSRELESLSERIKGLDRYPWRRRALKAAGEAVPLQLRPEKRPLHLHYVGISLADVKGVMRMVCIDEVPEPIRMARVLSSAFNRFLSR